MKPNKDKRHFVIKHLYWGDWVFFPNDSHFSFHIESEIGKGTKYYISNPQYKQYKTPCVKYPYILILKRGVEYCEVDKNTFYHLLWAMFKCHKWLVISSLKQDYLRYVPIRGSASNMREVDNIENRNS